MLSPFRIRDLRRPSSLPRPSLGDAARPIHDALVSMTAPEYDSTISNHPGAKLKYVDEDDGEVVTVGSSLELLQRLSEPILQSSHKERYKLRATPSPSGINVPTVYQDGSSYHVFEIDRSTKTICVWLDIEAKSDRAQLLQGFNSPEAVLGVKAASKGSESPRITQLTSRDSTPVEGIDTSVESSRRLHPEQRMPDDLEVHVDALDDESRMHELLQYHHQYFMKYPSIIAGITTADYNGSVHAMNNTTLEGKRQAQPAGEKTRNRTIAGRHIPGKASNVTSVNRWASYNNVNTVLTSPLLGNSVPASLTSEGKRQAQAAGDKLRTRTNPMRHAKSTRIESGVSKNRWPVYSGSRPLRFDDRLSSVVASDATEAASEPAKQYDVDRTSGVAKLVPGTTKPNADKDVVVSKQDNGSSSISPSPTRDHNHKAAVLQSPGAFMDFIKAVKAFADIAEKMGSELKDPLAKVVSGLDEDIPEVVAFSNYFLQLAFSEQLKEMRANVVPADASSQAKTKVSTHDTTATLGHRKTPLTNLNSGPTNDGYHVGAKARTLGSKSAIHVSSQDIRQQKRKIRSVLKHAPIIWGAEPSISNLLHPDMNSRLLLGPWPATNIPYELLKKQGNPISATPNDDSHHSYPPVSRSSYDQHPASYPFAERYNPVSTSPRTTLPYPSFNQSSPSSTRFVPVPITQGDQRHPEGEAIHHEVSQLYRLRTLEAHENFPNTAIPGTRTLGDFLSFPPLPSMEALQPSRPHNASRNVQDSTTDSPKPLSIGASGSLPLNHNASTGIFYRMEGVPSKNVQGSITDLPKPMSTRVSSFLARERPVLLRRKSEASEPFETRFECGGIFDWETWTRRGDEPPTNNVAQLKEHTENLTLLDKEGVQIYPANEARFSTLPPILDTAGKLSESKDKLKEFREQWLKEIKDEKSTPNGKLRAPPSRPGRLVSENGMMRRLPKVSAKTANTSSLQAPSSPPALDIDMLSHWKQTFTEQAKAGAEAKYYAEAKAKAKASAKSASLRKITECARLLLDMGFGRGETDGMARLMDIAGVAKGKLVDALDLLQEEQEAYKETNEYMNDKENTKPSS